MIRFSARSKAWWALFGVLASCALVLFVNPSEHTLIPCYFNVLTGYQCAGCGLTRATHHVFHGSWGTAWKFNPLVFVVLPLIAYSFTRYFAGVVLAKELPALFLSKPIIYSIAAILLIFTILRNLSF